MKKIFITLLLLSSSLSLLSQDQNALKYWHYRQRFLDKFIVRGIETNICGNTGGYSIPIYKISTYSEPEFMSFDSSGSINNSLFKFFSCARGM